MVPPSAAICSANLYASFQACYRLLQVDDMNAVAGFIKMNGAILGFQRRVWCPNERSFKKLLHRDNVCQKTILPFCSSALFFNARVPIHKVIGESLFFT
jgi:hypothetical protein